MTIVPILWYRPNKDKEYFVKVRITDNKKVSYTNLNISIPKRYWYKDRITNQHPDSVRLTALISQTVEELKTRDLKKTKNSKIGDTTTGGDYI